MAKKLTKSSDFDPVFNRLIDICDEKHTSVSKLLDMFTTSRSAISAWKKGNISANIISSIADYLDVTTDYLLKGEEQEMIALNEKETFSLTDIERKLIVDFRNLSQQGQDYIRQQMFIAREVYKKDTLSESDLNAG